MSRIITHTAAAHGPKSEAEGLAGIATAIAEVTGDLDVEPFLDRLLPRLARAIGAEALTVQLAERLREERVAGPEEAASAIESKRPLAVAGRILGVLWARYPFGASPAPGAERLLNLAACHLAFALDAARVARYERRWRQALELEARRKDDFLAVLAHELRAPLTAIRAAMRLFDYQDDNPEFSRKAREVIERQVKYQGRLLDDLLDAARIARDRIDLRRTVVDLQDVAFAAAEVTRPLVEERGHAFDVRVPVDTIRMCADAIRLEQVVVNLITNAAKYTPAGGEITLACERGADVAVLSVRDTGEGIAPEMLCRVFGLFVQAGAPGTRSRAGGLGIGLAVAKRLVELHGGTIEAHSAGRDRGSEFVVRLPLMADRIAAAA